MAGLLVLGILAVYSAAPRYEFVDWDDGLHVYKNPGLLNPSIQSIVQFFRAPFQGLYIPVTYSFWTLIAKYSLLDQPDSKNHLMSAGLFHFANLLFHIFNAVSVYLLGLLFINAASIKRSKIAVDLDQQVSHSCLASLMGAAFFALHPIQVEAVSWVTGFKDVLSTFFAFSALLHYSTYIQRGNHRPDASDFSSTTGVPQWLLFKDFRTHYYISTLFYVLAVLSKPSAISLPLIALLFSMADPTIKLKKLWVGLSPWALLAIVIAWVTHHEQPGTDLKWIAPFYQRPLIAGDAVTFYLSKLIVPIKLSPLYDRTPEWVIQQPWVYFTAAVPWVLGAFLYFSKKLRLILISYGILLASLLPVMGFIPFTYQMYSTVADRYLYFGVLGPALALMIGVFLLPSIWGVLSSAIVILFFACISYVQTGHWRTSVEILEYASSLNPKNLVAHLNLGAAYKAAARPADALSEYQVALTLAPEDPRIYFNIGGTKAALGHLTEAVEAFQQALKLDPGNPDIYNNLGAIYGKLGDLDSAAVQFSSALKANPHQAEAHNNLGKILALKGRLPEAIEHFREAVALKPYFRDAKTNLERALQGWK